MGGRELEHTLRIGEKETFYCSILHTRKNDPALDCEGGGITIHSDGADSQLVEVPEARPMKIAP